MGNQRRGKVLLWAALIGSLTAAAAGCASEETEELDEEPYILIRVDPVDLAGCPSGGSVYHFGPDLDGDDVLDDEEIRQSVVGCVPPT